MIADIVAITTGFIFRMPESTTDDVLIWCELYKTPQFWPRIQIEFMKFATVKENIVVRCRFSHDDVFLAYEAKQFNSVCKVPYPRSRLQALTCWEEPCAQLWDVICWDNDVFVRSVGVKRTRYGYDQKILQSTNTTVVSKTWYIIDDIAKSINLACVVPRTLSSRTSFFFPWIFIFSFFFLFRCYDKYQQRDNGK